jgi:hypothetical protein
MFVRTCISCDIAVDKMYFEKGYVYVYMGCLDLYPQWDLLIKS